MIIHYILKHFCRYCLHAFITEEILKPHIKECFKNNDKQTIKMPKKGEYVNFKNFHKKKKNYIIIHDLWKFGKYSSS